MKVVMSRLSGLVTVILLTTSLLVPASPASAGVTVWSAETIPSTVDLVLGPAGIDVRDLAVDSTGSIIYAVPGDSVSDGVVYKSVNAGASWTTLNVDIQADLVAVAPDDRNMVVIASSDTPEVYLTVNGGSTWYAMGTPQENGAAAAAAIYDLTISLTFEGKHYIAVAGKEAGDIANVWYYDYGAPVAAWKETNNLPGFSIDDEVAAVAFSPDFVSDQALLAVSEDDGASVKLQLLNLDTKRWNASAGFSDYPLTIISNSGMTGLASASISLDPDYSADNPGLHIVFFGLSVSGSSSAVAASGIYRLTNTVIKALKSDVQIHSVNFDGTYLAAGSYNTDHVYRSSNPLVTTPTVATVTTTKKPGGENKVVVAWAGSSLFAGTAGNESAFSVSTDKGANFNDISLIDTTITNARDVAVADDGSKVYLSTDDGTDLSLWRKDLTWKRILSRRGESNYIVRIAPENANVIYLARKSGATIYYNADAGATQWLLRTCKVNVQDLAVESKYIVYVLSSTGTVSRTINAGSSWGTATPTMLNSGATIVSVSTDTLLAGSQDGYVAYCTDSNLSWTRIPQILQSGAGRVQVAADDGFASNGVIYAASDTAGQNIKKWQIDTSTEWTDIFRNTIPGGIYGLKINNNRLYALAFNTTTGQSTLWLHLSPTTITDASLNWSSSTTTTTTDVDDTSVHLNATPRALKVSTDKQWAVKTNGINKLYSFSDIMMEIAGMRPASGFINRVNTITGLPHDVGFSWERPSEATEYELQIALDSEFYITVATIPVATYESTVFVLAGPNQIGNTKVDFMVGSTYYWRVRTTKPLYSAYSESQSFSVEPLGALLPGLITPANGDKDISRKPSFSWEPIAGASGYNFVLGDDPVMTSPIVDVKVENTAFTMELELDYGKTYFWKVRAIEPFTSDWSILANFTVEEEPVEPIPPVVVQQTPPAIIEFMESPPPDTITLPSPPVTPPLIFPRYLIAIIVVAAILLLAIIALIISPLPARPIPVRPAPVRPTVEPSPVNRGFNNMLEKLRRGLATCFQSLKIPGLLRGKETQNMAMQETADSQPISFAVKSFLWMLSSEKEESKQLLSVDEEQELGKKLASRIRDIASYQTLYLQFPEEAALFFYLWAHYGSRDETNSYLVDSFKSWPENVIEFLKCYLTSPRASETGTADNIDFSRARYDALAEVVDPDEVYNALTKLYGPELEWTVDKSSGGSPDRVIASQFARIHRMVKV